MRLICVPDLVLPYPVPGGAVAYCRMLSGRRGRAGMGDAFNVLLVYALFLERAE